MLARVYDERTPVATVAEETGRSPDAVKMLCLRLRKKLRACVTRRLEREEADVR